MTGFGLGDAPLGAGKLAVEIRGVNHRFLDVRVRAPRELADVATFIEQVAREKLTRGRYEVAMRLEGTVLPTPVLDRDRARAGFAALRELRDELTPGADVPLSLLAVIPDLFVSGLEREVETLRAAAGTAFAAAAFALDTMRAREGSALRADLVARLQQVRHKARDIAMRAPGVLETHRRRLGERAERLRGSLDIAVDAGRLEHEIALFAERSDVCEELTRLESHCAQFASLLETSEAVGRRLDFLLQEMAREANTIGAKSPDAQIAHTVVDVKAEIERMREQVQNVE
ncbi:MAG: YicC family protein [Myxococcota bacterium]|nr:YicC family protein [Myxococcota bacterium]